MRLLFLTNVFPSPWNPTRGTFNLEMTRSLAKRHSVEVVVPIAWTDELRALRAGRGAAKRCEERDGLTIHYPRYWFPPKLGRASYDRFMDWSLRNILREREHDFRPDAVLGYWAHPDGAVAVRSARRCGAAAWIMVGGSDVLLLAKEPKRGSAARAALTAADGVIVVSDHLRERLIDFGIEPDRVHVVYRGVDRARFYAGDRLAARQKLKLPLEAPLLLWVGRMVDVKGLNVLLAAVAKLAPQHECLRLYLVGDGPLRGQLEAQAKSLGISSCVRFAGSVPHSELGDWYRAADWAVLSSRSEGVPNVLLESHACGTPFISTDVGGVREIANGAFDHLCFSGDPTALAEAIGAALDSASANGQAISATVPDIDVATEALVACIARTTPAGPTTRHSENIGPCATL